MTGKRLEAGTLVGMALFFGISIWNNPNFSTALRTYVHQLFSHGQNPEHLRAEQASPYVVTPLQPDQQQELIEGMQFLIGGRYAQAVPILSKYANLGDVHAQSMMGSIYYFGLGLPQDRAQALQWFRLAANQGNPSDMETLAEAAGGALVWDAAPRQSALPLPGNASTNMAPATALAQNNSANVSPLPMTSYAPNQNTVVMPPIGARASVSGAYGDSPASRVNEADMPSPRRIQDPVILNRAGPNSFTDRNGNTYTNAGPHGVINNQTGQFSPTN